MHVQGYYGLKAPSNRLGGCVDSMCVMLCFNRFFLALLVCVILPLMVIISPSLAHSEFFLLTNGTIHSVGVQFKSTLWKNPHRKVSSLQ